MKNKRIIIQINGPFYSGRLIPIDSENLKYLHQYKIGNDDKIEVLSKEGPWIAKIVSIENKVATAKLESPIHINVSHNILIHACLPITSNLDIWSDWIPSLVELGVTDFHPIIYQNSNYDETKTLNKFKKWNTLINKSTEFSHRSSIPQLYEPRQFQFLLQWNISQKFLITKTSYNQLNPRIDNELIAFTCGPEDGLTYEEILDLTKANWQHINLGESDMRTVTAPIAFMGAIRFELNR